MMYVYMTAIVMVVIVVIGLYLVRAHTLQGQAGMSARQKRYEVHEHAVLELTQAKERAEIDTEAYEWELQQLNQRLVKEMTDLEPSSDSTLSPLTRREGRHWVYVLLLIPLLAAGLYFFLGQSVPDPAERLQRTGDVGEFLDQIESLEAKVKVDPDNLLQQLMLARSYRVMGRYPEAVVAYGKAWPIIQEEPSELALFAEVIALQRGTFEGKADELLLQAQELDADNLDVLMLMGESAIQKEQYEAALPLLESLKEKLAASGEDTEWLDAKIESLHSVLK